MSKPAYLIVLEGQGDVEVKLVDQEVWDWINRDDSVERAQARADGSYCWDEKSIAPNSVVDAWPEDERILITTGSSHNDRMLMTPEKACLFSEYGGTEVEEEAQEWARKNGYEIMDTVEGCIY